VLLQLRRVMPEVHRPFKLWWAWIITPLAFIASNFIMFWAGFAVVNFLYAILLGALVVYLIYRTVKSGEKDPLDWRHALWLIPYFGGMWILSYLAPTSMGGNGMLNIYWDMLAIALLSLVIIYIALKTSVSAERSRAYYTKILESEVSADGPQLVV